jgi:two-component system, OmpR family, KDP operon response regulator KdpE
MSDQAPTARILHVEDEELNRTLLRAVLQRAPDPRLRSASLLEAGTLGQARAILTQQPIDLVLLDVRLPDGNGLDLVREIKSRDPALGVVVMSASVLPAEREEAMGAGCDAFVAKPYVPGELLATLERILLTAPTDD